MSKIPKIVQNDPRVIRLLNEIKQKIEIRFQKSKTESWGVDIQNGIAYIEYCSCNNIVAAFAHELLHIDTQLKGFKRIRIGISLFDQTPLFSRFMTCLDNELQHHKFYSKFILLGFDQKSFYADSDIQIESYLRSVLQNDIKKIIEILPEYFTLIAQGGSLHEEVKSELLNKFYSLNSGVFKCQLEQIKKICDNWRASTTFDNTSVLREIMLTLQPTPNLTWFGFNLNDQSPNQGFFVDKIFEVEIP
jgi:hypothetical protein